MTKRIKTPDGKIMHLIQTKKLGHGIQEKEDPKSSELVWVLHNTEGPAILHPDGKKEYYFWGIFQGTSSECVAELKRNHNGIPPSKNPLYKNDNF